jgi:hypothetical protein
VAPGYKLKCPFGSCGGELSWVGTETTCMYFTKTDKNRKTEWFTCRRCKKEFSRTFKWNFEGTKEAESND